MYEEMQADPAYRKVFFTRRFPLMFAIIVFISFLHGRDAVQKGESIAPILIGVVFMTAVMIAAMSFAISRWRVVRNTDGSIEVKQGLFGRKLGRPGTQVRCELVGENWEIQEAYSGIRMHRLPRAAFPHLDRLFQTT